jgi:hypothetical protein
MNTARAQDSIPNGSIPDGEPCMTPHPTRSQLADAETAAAAATAGTLEAHTLFRLLLALRGEGRDECGRYDDHTPSVHTSPPLRRASRSASVLTRVAVLRLRCPRRHGHNGGQFLGGWACGAAASFLGLAQSWSGILALWLRQFAVASGSRSRSTARSVNSLMSLHAQSRTAGWVDM